jgi:hypothetical protein
VWPDQVMLDVISMSLLHTSKNEVTFKITIRLVIDQNFVHMVILKATSFLEGHEYDI